jgi:mRNA interferase RelE/StbE
VSYTLSWNEAALNTAAGFLRDDPTGLHRLMDALDHLVDDPRPDHSTALGNPDLRRLHVDRYRALYEITEPTKVITVIHIGRLG